MYILMEGNIVQELIPDRDPAFPSVPIEDRYEQEFLAKLKHFPDGTQVEPGMIYDGEFFHEAPPPPAPAAPVYTEMQQLGQQITDLELMLLDLTLARESAGGGVTSEPIAPQGFAAFFSDGITALWRCGK